MCQVEEPGVETLPKEMKWAVDLRGEGDGDSFLPVVSFAAPCPWSCSVYGNSCGFKAG